MATVNGVMNATLYIKMLDDASSTMRQATVKLAMTVIWDIWISPIVMLPNTNQVALHECSKTETQVGRTELKASMTLLRPHATTKGSQDRTRASQPSTAIVPMTTLHLNLLLSIRRTSASRVKYGKHHRRSQKTARRGAGNDGQQPAAPRANSLQQY